MSRCRANCRLRRLAGRKIRPLSRMRGIYKESVEGPVWLGTINLDSDRQADLKNHGGEDTAVNAYPADPSPGGHAALARPEMTLGEAMATLARPATHLRWIPRHAREKGRRVATYE